MMQRPTLDKNKIAEHLNKAILSDPSQDIIPFHLIFRFDGIACHAKIINSTISTIQCCGKLTNGIIQNFSFQDFPPQEWKIIDIKFGILLKPGEKCETFIIDGKTRSSTDYLTDNLYNNITIMTIFVQKDNPFDSCFLILLKLWEYISIPKIPQSDFKLIAYSNALNLLESENYKNKSQDSEPRIKILIIKFISHIFSQYIHKISDTSDAVSSQKIISDLDGKFTCVKKFLLSMFSSSKYLQDIEQHFDSAIHAKWNSMIIDCFLAHIEQNSEFDILRYMKYSTLDLENLPNNIAHNLNIIYREHSVNLFMSVKRNEISYDEYYTSIINLVIKLSYNFNSYKKISSVDHISNYICSTTINYFNQIETSSEISFRNVLFSQICENIERLFTIDIDIQNFEKEILSSSNFSVILNSITQKLLLIEFKKKKVDNCHNEITKSVYDTLIPISKQIQSYLNKLFQNKNFDKTDDALIIILQIMKLIFLKTNIISEVKKYFKKYIDDIICYKNVCCEIALITFCDAIDKAFILQFQNFNFLIGEKNNSISYVLAVFIDRFCQNKLKNLEFNNIDNIAEIILLIQDKDELFEMMHTNLTRRLLRKTSSIDSEKELISTIKKKFSCSELNKLEFMIRDIESVKNNEDNFQIWDEKNSDKLDINTYKIILLTSSHWPSFRNFTLNFHYDFYKITNKFEQFYKEFQPKRKIRWIHDMTTCELEIKFPIRTKKIICQSVHAHILLAISSFSNPPSAAEIAIHIGLTSPEQVIGFLQPLTNGKPPFVVEENGKYFLNADFSHSMQIFNFLPSQTEKPAQEKLDAHRNTQLDCLIVRIMKNRRYIEHQELISESQNQIKRLFSAQTRTIKRRIEHLMATGYIKRSDKNETLLEYLA